MISELNNSENQKATDLIKKGFKMAGSTLESVLKNPVLVKYIEYNINSVLSGVKSNNKATILKTDLIGDLSGTSYLILSNDDVQKIYQTCLPKELHPESNEDLLNMKIDFLTEIDNMVSAAFITEISNVLNVEIFGQVPIICQMEIAEVQPYLEDQSNSLKTFVHFKAEFEISNMTIKPDFVWIFHKSFLKLIKSKF